jgi:hypothetical protein
LPKSLNSIGYWSFKGNKGAVFITEEGSYAQKWVAENVE